jgi:hypothetical protein
LMHGAQMIRYHAIMHGSQISIPVRRRSRCHVIVPVENPRQRGPFFAFSLTVHLLRLFACTLRR